MLCEAEAEGMADFSPSAGPEGEFPGKSEMLRAASPRAGLDNEAASVLRKASSMLMRAG